MPTFKAGFVQPQPDKSEKENLAETLAFTLNHLDEENLNDSVLRYLTQQEGEHG